MSIRSLVGLRRLGGAVSCLVVAMVVTVKNYFLVFQIRGYRTFGSGSMVKNVTLLQFVNTGAQKLQSWVSDHKESIGYLRIFILHPPSLSTN